MSTLKEIVAGFTPETDKALVFSEIADNKRELERLLAGFQELTGRKLDYEVFKGDASVIVLVRLVSDDAKEAAVMLSESGVNNLMVLFPRKNKQKPALDNRSVDIG